MSTTVGTSSIEGSWAPEERHKKVVICTPTLTKPYPGYLDSLKASVPLLEAAGWAHGAVLEIGNPYISMARSLMTRKALDAGATVILYIDHDLSWQPDAILRVIEAEGDVVCGTYRYKREPVEYMGRLMPDVKQLPQVRADGAVKAFAVPGGFLKITRAGINRFAKAYPELLYGEATTPGLDLFNHGAHDGIWFGEDYAFSRRWLEKCGDIWLIPDLDIDHHTHDAVFPGNYHQYLLRQDGGSESDNPCPPS